MQYLSSDNVLQGGKYKIVRFLSSGGFGNTYEGVHTMLDTRVAINAPEETEKEETVFDQPEDKSKTPPSPEKEVSNEVKTPTKKNLKYYFVPKGTIGRKEYSITFLCLIISLIISVFTTPLIFSYALEHSLHKEPKDVTTLESQGGIN